MGSTLATKEEAEKNRASLVNWGTLVFTGLAAVFTGCLVIVGCRGVNAANRTLRAIEKQVSIMVNSERAWVIVSLVHSQELLIVAPGAIQPYNTFEFDIINKGRTVARLMEVEAEYRVLPKNEVLPPVPIYGNPASSMLTVIHGRVMAPEDRINHVSYGITEWIDTPKFNRILSGDLVLYVYAFIKYFDLAEVERKLQFCYRYLHTGIRMERGATSAELLGQWVLAGPPDYNTHT
jgi:hypothetical protein